MNVVAKRLAYCRFRFVSLGVELLLLNLILNSITIYFLSFMKMLVAV